MPDNENDLALAKAFCKELGGFALIVVMCILLLAALTAGGV